MILDSMKVTREFTKDGKKPITVVYEYLTEDGLKAVQIAVTEDYEDYAGFADYLNSLRDMVDKHIEPV